MSGAARPGHHEASSASVGPSPCSPLASGCDGRGCLDGRGLDAIASSGAAEVHLAAKFLPLKQKH